MPVWKKPDLIRIGRISKVFGTQGELVLDPRLSLPDLPSDQILFIALEGIHVPFFMRSLKVRTDGRYQLGLEEVDTPETAQRLIGSDAFMESRVLSAPRPDELLVLQLVGFEAVDDTLGSLGTIKDILEYPEQDMLVVASDQSELLIPLVEAFIIDIDAVARTIHFDLPEGMVASQTEEAGE